MAQRKKSKEDLFKFEPGIMTPDEKPKNRLECKDIPRPCPFVSCRYHLYLDVFENGQLKINFKNTELQDMPATCSLDLAETGGMDLEQIGQSLNFTRERVRQILEGAFKKIRENADEEVIKILFSFYEPWEYIVEVYNEKNNK